MICKLFPNQCNVYARGPVGENVLHVAMLLNNPSTLAIARYLIKLYGKPLVNCPFQERRAEGDAPGAYEGETALHIAIVNRDFDMVKSLVHAGADIRARAWGTFFAPDGPMYHGEYPLSFAACTGQKDVVAYLRRHGARVDTDRDVHGNAALHLCVHHGRADMYDFLVEYCAASEGVQNHAGLTPLVLAAQLGRADMFQHILSKRRRAFYTFGSVRRVFCCCCCVWGGRPVVCACFQPPADANKTPPPPQTHPNKQRKNKKTRSRRTAWRCARSTPCRTPAASTCPTRSR